MSQIIDNLSKILTPAMISGGAITTTGSGATFTVAAGEALGRTSNDSTAPLKFGKFPEVTGIAITDATTLHVIVDFAISGDTDVEPSIRTNATDDSNGNSSICIGTVTRAGSSQTITYRGAAKVSKGCKVLKMALTQSSTDAPTAIIRKNDFAGADFTLGYTSAGLYTITASEAIFTSGKTYTFTSDIQNGLHNFKVVVTSTTVLTITTNLISGAAAVTATNALLSNTMLVCEVYE